MANHCTHCGNRLETNAAVCPYCNADLTVAGAVSTADGSSVHVVTAPVRKKRTLPMSCLTGLLIFSPTILLVGFLMYFYFERNQEREEQPINPVYEARYKEKLLNKLAKVMNQLVLNSRPELIESMKAESEDVLVIHVSSEWDDLTETTRSDLRKRWLVKWKSLEGTSIRIVSPLDAKLPTKGQ